MGKTFDQLYAELSAQTPVAPKRPRKKIDFSKLEGGPTGNDRPPQDPVSWIVDILSRPLYSVTETVDSAMEAGSKKRQAQREKQGPGGWLEDLGKVASAPVRGFFSTDRDDKRTFSELIEKGTDTVGAFDPAYKNEKENVDPLIKGTLGLVGDIALDPLTYVPGAVFAKAGAQIGKGLSKATGRAGEAKKLPVVGSTKAGAKEAVELPENAEDLARMAETTNLQKGAPTPEIDITKPSTELGIPSVPVPKKVSELVAENPRTAKAESFLADITKSPEPNPVVAKPLPQGAWIQEFIGKAPDKATITVQTMKGTEVVESKVKLSTLKRNPGLITDEIAAQLDVIHQSYVQGFDKAKSQGLLLQPDGKTIPMPKPSEIPDTKLARYQEIIQTEEGLARAEAALGTNLVNQLRRKRSPESFDRTLQQVSDVLVRREQLDTITDNAQLKQGAAEIMRALGIDVAATNTKAFSDASRVAEANANKSALEGVLENAGVPRDQVSPAVFDRLDPQSKTQRELDFNESELAKDLSPSLRKELFENTKYSEVTFGGAVRTEATQGLGFAKMERILNTRSQWNFAQDLMASTARQAEQVTDRLGRKLFGQQRAAWKRDHYMPKARALQEIMDREGIQMYLGTRDDLIPLSDAQLREMLDTVNSRAMLKYLYNPETAVPLTNLYDAVVRLHAGGDRADVMAELVKRETMWGQGGKIANPLAGDKSRVYGAVLQGKAPEGATLVPSKSGKNSLVKWDADYLANELTDLVMSIDEPLRSTVAANARALRARIDKETGELTEAGLNRLNELSQTPQRMAEEIRATFGIAKEIVKLGDDAGATSDAIIAAATNVDATIKPVVEKSARAAAKGADARKRAATEAEGLEAQKLETQKAVTATIADAEGLHKLNLAREVNTPEHAQQVLEAADPIADISLASYRDVGTLRERFFDPLFKRFDAKYQHQRVYHFQHEGEVAGALRRAKMTKDLNQIQKTHAGLVGGTETPVLQRAFADLQAGIPSSDPLVEAARADLEQLWGSMFDTTKSDSILGNVFFRNPVAIDHVQQAMKEVGIMFDFELDLAKRAAKENGTDLLTEAIEQWRTWGVEDPLDFIQRMYVAAEKVSTRASIAQTFVHWGRGAGLISDTMKPGFAKLTNSGPSVYYDMLPKSYYYDRQLMNEFGLLDKIAQMSATPSGELGKFVTDIFDPIQQTWKFAITSPRPGHHIRNLVGDTSLTYMAEGPRFFRRSAQDAFRVLGANKHYEGVDLNRAMAFQGDIKIADGGAVIASGKYGDINAKEMWAAAYKHGILNSYHSIEDFTTDSSGALSRAMNKIAFRGGKFEQLLGNVSEARDHYSRMQHFIQYIHKAQLKGTAKNREDLFREASLQVKKYHADGSQLAGFEKMWMRRAIPFYSWLRGAIPAIIESTVLRPGRVLAFPKASYNLAVGMGVDPYSLSDPFPEDQMFPSFLDEQVFGPQFGNKVDGYFGINPGIAHVDVADQFLADPLRGVLGSTTPLFRVPAELAAGGSWSTGAPIRDASDYIDNALPGINYASNLSGYSTSGSLVGLLQGNGLDPQAQVAAGNKTGTDKMLSALNWITGVGAQNMSRPNFINYAEIEKRNRESGDARF